MKRLNPDRVSGGLRANPWTGPRRLYHGTSRAGAESIMRDGVDIEKSSGGYYGWAFYVTPDKSLAESNYADWAEDDEPGAVVEVELLDASRILDTQDPADWEIWRPWGRRVSDKNLWKTLVRRGIDGVVDLASMGGIAIYNAKVVRPVQILGTNPDRIPGGLAAGRSPSDFDRAALARGTAVELEHTSDPRVAQEIAMDHLTEDPQYYEKLARMEAQPNPPHDYVFWTTCVNSVGVLINEMQEQAQDVTYETMLAHCRGLLDEAVNCGYERRSTSGHGLTLKNDWSVSYHKSKYCGVPCYYFVWSHIEHVWVRPEDQEKIVACEERARAAERGRTSILARSEEFRRGWEEGSRPEEEDEVEENPAAAPLPPQLVLGPPNEKFDLAMLPTSRATPLSTRVAVDKPRPEGDRGYLWSSTLRGVDEQGRSESEWTRWLECEWTSKLGGEKAVFDVAADAKILHIRNIRDFRRVATRYPAGEGHDREHLDWPAIARDYDAVHFGDEKTGEVSGALYFTMYGWDVESTVWFDPSKLIFRGFVNPAAAQRLLTPAEKRALFPGVRRDAEVFVGPEWDAALARLHRNPADDFEVKEFEGEEGNSRHLTRREYGNLDPRLLASIPGKKGEQRYLKRHHGELIGSPRGWPEGQEFFGRYPIEKWQAFVEDVGQRGVLDPVLIIVDPDEGAKVYEGNHRIAAAVAAGLQAIPVEIRYFGHAERQHEFHAWAPRKRPRKR